MNLRTKLFLLFGVLMVVLTLAQWWLVRSLTQQAYQEFGDAVVSVSRQVADLIQCDLIGLAERLQQEGKVEQIRVVKRRQEEAASLAELPFIAEKEGLKNRLRVQGLLSDPSSDGKTHSSRREIDFRYNSGQPSSQMSLRIQGEGIDRTIELPSQGLQSSLDQLSSRLLYGTLAILATGLAFAAVLAGRVSRPLQDLSGTAQGVASGRLGLQVTGTSSQAGGEVGQAIAAFNHMSRQLQSYEKSRRAWEERRHLSELGEIARGLAHTIRNPLNALGLSVEELAARKQASGDDADQLAVSARRQIRRIDHWIRSFLTLASQEGQYSRPVALQPLLEDILLEVVQDSQARIHLKQPANDLPEILAVEAELRGMIQALAVNAAEAAGENGNVWIEARPEADGRVRIEVRDDGPGLPEEVRERLFAPHVTTKPWGSGMGIYLAQRIAATRYGGRLEYEEGHPGTQAVLTLNSKRTED